MTTHRYRCALLGRVHHQARALRLEGSRWRTMLMCMTGKQSCKELDTDELQRVAKILEQMVAGTDPDAPPAILVSSSPALPPALHPTPRQWGLLDELARQMGWDGVYDERLRGFVIRTTSCMALEAMTRRQVSACITGLMCWQEQIKGKRDANPQQGRK